MTGDGVLVTGATGTIGSQLVPQLVKMGHRPRVLVRDLSRVPDAWRDHVDVVEGDLLDPASIRDALEDVEAAYYLVHSVGETDDFTERDHRMADAFADAAGAAGIDLVVYLGGLVPREGAVSPHLASRRDVGRVLRDRCPTVELRAGPIIGEGSGSWEMVRHLVDRLPVMVAPRWIDNEVQPIHVDDVVAYLAACLDADPRGVVEIGGADVVTFREMMQTYATLTGRRRLIVKVPLLVPSIAALWIGLVTPIPNALAVPLVEGITSSVTAETDRARDLFPEVEPCTYEDAVRRVLAGRTGP